MTEPKKNLYDELDEIKEEQVKQRVELAWLRRGLYALAAVAASPKVGGPDLSDQVAAVARLFIGA